MRTRPLGAIVNTPSHSITPQMPLEPDLCRVSVVVRLGDHLVALTSPDYFSCITLLYARPLY